jgi:hypothetical protein
MFICLLIYRVTVRPMLLFSLQRCRIALTSSQTSAPLEHAPPEKLEIDKHLRAPLMLEKVPPMSQKSAKERAVEEMHVLDLLFQRFRNARESNRDVDLGVLEADIQTHFRDHEDLTTALSGIGDEESLLLIRELETHHRAFADITESPSTTDLSQIPNSAIELDVPRGTDQKDTYQPVEASERLSQRGAHNSISTDFFWSLLLSLFISACFAIIWKLFLR